jgi:hypothetical protein
MDKKVKEAIFRQVEKEPFYEKIWTQAGRFG